MNLAWDSLADFAAMGGYALYVWGSFGMVAVALAWELATLLQRQRRALEELEQQRQLEAAAAATARVAHDAAPPPRAVLALVLLGATGTAVALVTSAFRSNLVFFHSPSDVSAAKTPLQRTFRLGGLVEAGSLRRDPAGVDVHFVVTDTAERVAVRYRGILPDLFQEGKGVVAQGRLGANGEFIADEVLAKHDENYMPPEAADALERVRRAQAQSRAAP